MRQCFLSFNLIVLLFISFGCPAKNKDTKKLPTDQTAPKSTPNLPSTLEEKYADCEQKYRPFIQANNKPFEKVERFNSEIQEMNQLASGKVSFEKLAVLQMNSQITQYEKATEYETEFGTVSRSTTIGLNEKDAANAMYFQLELSRKSRTMTIEILQKYSMASRDKNCEPQLSFTEVNKIERVSELAYKVTQVSIAYDGSELKNTSFDLQLQSGQLLNDFIQSEIKSEDETVLFGKKGLMSLIQGTDKLLELQYSAASSSQEAIFGKTVNLSNIKVTALLGDEIQSITSLSLNKEQKITVATYENGQRYFGVPFSENFEKVHLGQAQNYSQEKSNLDEDYQKENNQIRVTTNKKIDYDHFAAYWKIVKEDHKSKSSDYVLEENHLPIADGPTTAEDLISNSTIQTELPEIQAIAAKISKSSLDRVTQIQFILDHLKNNYIYDKEMVSRNVIRPLTTKEALDRKKGVCQHYAVIFVAIARALKIPSRIVMGHLIDGAKLGNHAWVEAEISEGRWQVIEPQMQTALTETRARFYFPLMRATLQEDKDSKLTNEQIKFLMDKKIEIQKVTNSL
jgi:hypothetical protein